MTIREPGTPSGPIHSDSDAMNEIALTLGRPATWTDVRRYLDEAADAIAATGRPRPRGSAKGAPGPASFGMLDHFKTGRPRPAHDEPAARDWDGLNQMALELSRADWSIESVAYIADAVAATGRPHPGGSLHGRAYEICLARWLGEDTGLPSGTLVITVDDADLPDNPVEPWTATASWQQGDGATGWIGVGGGATISHALRDLARDLETSGLLEESQPMP